jgi:hypothetical protein
VVAWKLGFVDIRIDMAEDGRAVTRYEYPGTIVGDTTTISDLVDMIADADNGRTDNNRSDHVRAVFARLLNKCLTVAVAGTVAETKIGGYQEDTAAEEVELSVDGTDIVTWLASRVACLEAGLPICEHSECRPPVAANCLNLVVKRATRKAEVESSAGQTDRERVVQARPGHHGRVQRRRRRLNARWLKCNPGAYLMGCNAAFDGQTLDDCPYIPDDDDGWERDEWLAGFEDAVVVA